MGRRGFFAFFFHKISQSVFIFCVLCKYHMSKHGQAAKNVKVWYYWCMLFFPKLKLFRIKLIVVNVEWFELLQLIDTWKLTTKISYFIYILNDRMKIRSSKVQFLCILGAVKEHIWGTFIHTYNLLASKWKFILGLSRKFIVRKVSNRVFVFLPITLMVATIVITMIMVMSVYLEKRMPNNYHNYEIKIFKNLFLPVDIFS